MNYQSLAMGAVLTLACIGVAQAKDEPCADGVDCLCDRITNPGDPIYSTGVLLCEDFEAADLPQRSNVVPGRTGWHAEYGSGVAGCIHNPLPGTGVGFTQMGRDPDDCIDIFEESGPHSCEGGDTDCVFQGGQVLGFRMRPGVTGGIVGEGYWDSPVRDFGYTIALRYSPNYLAPGDSGLSHSQPAEKFDEFGTNRHALMGASNTNAGRNHPFSGTVMTMLPAPSYNTGLGRTTIIDTGKYKMSPSTSVYEWKRDFDVAEWGCFQMEIDNWGTSNMRLRYWFNGEKMYDGTLDASRLQGGKDQTGIQSLVWNAYRNEGYAGPSVAVRYEDNVVVTAGAPVSCEDIGFNGVSSPDPDPAGPPAPPVLLP